MSELHPLVFGIIIGAVHLFGYVTGAWRQRLADRKDIAYVLGMDEEATWGQIQERAQHLRKRVT